MKLAARLRVSVLDPGELSDIVRRHADHKGLRLHPMPWGYCAWWKEASKAAKCVEDRERKSGDSRPQTRKTAEVCGNGCANFVLHYVFRPLWAGAVKRHSAVRQR
jgi:hypothetical protein